MSEDFSLYIHRPTATDPSFAPEGCDSFYVLCPVPNLQGNINWDEKSKILKEDDKTKLMSLSGVKKYPMRVKCATLPWHTLISAMTNKPGEVNTEKDN